eukprot:CAMPEP_0115042148 /NCGR_PEP_ID=MMETSP0216-20121206/46101_1 /TAXON_ID=223996 /ORGANISM="Protocruzia adherens, Strain Boccale" /LENGTH=487 /DNA_ID=CAMNT_0002424223 /DNA_START=123 /DNA_END=1586 /DNA_ORIENTATION=+
MEILENESPAITFLTEDGLAEDQRPEYIPYCERLRRTPPNHENKFFFVDDVEFVWSDLFEYRKWVRVGPLAYLEPENNLRRIKERAYPPTHKDYAKFAPEEVSVYLIKLHASNYYRNMKYNVDYACSDMQMINEIPGFHHVTHKHRSSRNFQKLSDVYKLENRTHCFNIGKNVPLTYDLSIKRECQTFFSRFLKERAIDPDEINWIVKATHFMHKGMGVYVLTKDYGDELLAQYKSGSLCGLFETKQIAQQYVKETFLINNRKFDFRLYMFISSTDPLVAWYHDGFIRLSVTEFDPNSKDKFAHLTNVSQAKLNYNNNSAMVENSSTMTIDDLQAYLERKGLHQGDPNFARNRLLRQAKQNMVHMLRSGQRFLEKGWGYFQVFGLDYMVDKNFNLWFIENNATPSYGEIQWELKRKMLLDFHTLIEARLSGATTTKELPKTSWQPLADESIEGPGRYFGLLDEDCTNPPDFSLVETAEEFANEISQN